MLDGRESVRQSGEGYLWCFGRAREVTVVASRAGSRRERNMVPAANRLNIKKTCSVRVQEIDLGDKINKRRRPVSLRSASEKEKKREKDRFRIRKQVRGNSSCTEGPRHSFSQRLYICTTVHPDMQPERNGTRKFLEDNSRCMTRVHDSRSALLSHSLSPLHGKRG